MNFLQETLRIMEVNKVDPDEVVYVFNDFGYCSWEEFEKVANFEYDNGYGVCYVGLDLVVRGSDWWLERREYDGAEWWSFRRFPEKENQVHTEHLVLKEQE